MPRTKSPKPPKPPEPTPPTKPAAPAVPPPNPVVIEWSTEAKAWEGSIDGVEGVVLGESPCEAAEHLIDGILFGFRALEVYGVERLIAGAALSALNKLKRDVRTAHEAAHEAESCLAEAQRTNALS